MPWRSEEKANHLHVWRIVILVHKVDVSVFGSILVGDIHNAASASQVYSPLASNRAVNHLPQTARRATYRHGIINDDDGLDLATTYQHGTGQSTRYVHQPLCQMEREGITLDEGRVEHVHLGIKLRFVHRSGALSSKNDCALSENAFTIHRRSEAPAKLRSANEHFVVGDL